MTGTEVDEVVQRLIDALPTALPGVQQVSIYDFRWVSVDSWKRPRIKRVFSKKKRAARTKP